MFEIKDETFAAKLLIKTHYIMKVTAFYPDTQTVDLVQETFGFTNTPFGTMTVNNVWGQTVTAALTIPDVILGVPVQQLRWGQFQIQCAPVPGDTGYIEVFTDDIRSWVKDGGPAVPWSDQRFIKESCVFVPFVPNHTNAATDYPTDNTKLVIKSANASIVLTDTSGAEESTSEPTVDITTTAQTVNINAEKGFNVNGDVTIVGNITVTGDVTVDGNINATGEISSDETVTGKKDVIGGGISLKNHTHPFTYSAGPSAGAAGTTNPPE